MKSIRYSIAVVSVLAFAWPADRTRAAITATAVELGGDVVITASGTLDLTSGTFFGPLAGGGLLVPNTSLGVGPPGNYDAYGLGVSGPSAIGPGTTSFAPSSASGDLFGISFGSGLGVPTGYLSGSPLSGSSTHAGHSFASLGLTPGLYEWTWPSGATTDSFTLTVGTPTTARILLVGDSWLSQSCDAFVYEAALTNRGLGQYSSACTTTTIPGSRAFDWAGPSHLGFISDALSNNRSASIVHLSMGGNDPAYYIGQSVPPEVYFPLILADIQTVVDHILAVRPWARVTIWPYDYTVISNNAGLGAFAQALIDLAALTPGFYVLNTAGVLHHTFGFPTGVPPFNAGETPLPGGYPNYVPLLGGDPNQQADPATFVDDAHPTTASYVALAEFGIDEFYESWLPPATAPILDVVGGQLMGAYGVNVDGDLYNVEFLDGSCIDLFTGCDETGDFAFTTIGEAGRASEALLDQVFSDGVDGMFDSDPSLTSGITHPTDANIYTPSFIPSPPNGNVAVSPSHNGVSEGSDFVSGGSGLAVGDDVSAFSHVAYARWTPVPEPSHGSLLSGGILGLAGLARLRRRRG